MKVTKIPMSDMNRRLSTTPHTIAKLTRSQEGWHITQDKTWGNLGHQTPQSASHSNKVNSTSLLLMAVNLAPKNKWWISTGVSPFKTRDIKVVMKKERRGQTQWGTLRRSFRCWGCRPSGPPAEPAGKDRITFATWPGDTEIGRKSAGKGTGGRLRMWQRVNSHKG